MKRLLLPVVLGFSVIFLLAACHTKTSTSFGLTVQKAALAKMGPNNKLVPNKDDSYTRGEKIYFVLLNVGKFQQDAQGLNNFDMDMKITNSDGKVVLERKALLGKNGHVKLPNDTAASPHVMVPTSENVKPGKYKITVTIYDKIGKGSASESATFDLK